MFEQLEPRLLLDGTLGVVEEDPPPQEDLSSVPVEFVRAEGTGFKLGNDPFYAPGTNNYYLLSYASSNGTRAHVDEVLEDAADMGLKVIRAWAFNDGAGEWNALQTAPGVFVERVFRGLDYVIYKAGQVGLRLILPFVNNWDDYGGMSQYIAWDPIYGTNSAQVATKHNDFYTDADTRRWYKSYVHTLVNRTNTYTGVKYKDDPTIFAWQLANEPRATGDRSGNVLQRWMQEMSTYIKRVDPNHMLTTGEEGFYSGRSGGWKYDGSEGMDFIRNHRIAEIDFATVHLYPDQWGLNYNTSLAWYQEHINDARNILGKPLLLEEFGIRVDATSTQARRNMFYRGLFDLADSTDSAGWNFWMLAHSGYQYGSYNVFYPDARDASTVAIISQAARTMTNRPPAADLSGAFVSATLPAVALSGTRLQGSVSVKVTNGGNAPVADGHRVEIAILAVSKTNGARRLLRRQIKTVGGLDVGQARVFDLTLNLPAGIPAGEYALWARIKPVDGLVEQSSDNNLVRRNTNGRAISLTSANLFADLTAMLRNGTRLPSRQKLLRMYQWSRGRTPRLTLWRSVTRPNHLTGAALAAYRQRRKRTSVRVSASNAALIRQIRWVARSKRRRAYYLRIARSGNWHGRVLSSPGTWARLPGILRYVVLWHVLSSM